jgi:drug/metabolite transporter (DMT)-like permease
MEDGYSLIYPCFRSADTAFMTKSAPLQLNQRNVNRNLVNWVLFVMLSFIWGSSFILMKKGMEGLSAYQVASIRILSAGIVLLPFSIGSFRAVPAEKRGLVFLSGLLGTFFPAYLFCIAETRIDSSLAGILNALTPIFTLLIGAFFFGQQIGWKKWLGVTLGFIGLVALILSGSRSLSLGYMGYASFILIATLLYGINVNLVNRYLRETGPVDIATVAFSMLIIPSLMILYLTGYFSMPEKNWSWDGPTSASAMLGILGTAAASVIFYKLLKRAGPVFSSMVTYGIPFVAIFWGVMAGETINALQIGCLSVILGGVYLANK